MGDFDELFHGKDYADKQELFRVELLAIQEKHIEYFKSRPKLLEEDEHDLLHNHYATKYQDGVFEFWWRNDSELPNNIRSEGEEAFNRVFKVSE